MESYPQVIHQDQAVNNLWTTVTRQAGTEFFALGGKVIHRRARLGAPAVNNF